MSENLNQQGKTDTAINPKNSVSVADKQEQKAKPLKHFRDWVANKISACMSNKEREKQEASIKLCHILIVPIFSYLSFFCIVVFSFWLFKPANVSLQNMANQPLTEKQRTQIEVEVNKIINRRLKESNKESPEQKAFSENPNSILAKAYIDGQIKQEAQEQAEKAAKDEVNNLKADWKGDLFGQISFPVIFAVASIFAAFAVKDILTEIFKEQERSRIKQELERELKERVVPEAIKHNQQETNNQIETIESYTYWLEYEMLTIAVNQVVDDIKKPVENSIEVDEYILPVVQQFFSRADFALEKVSRKVRKAELELIRKSDFRVLESKFDDIFLSAEVQKCFENRSKEIENKEISSESEREYGIVRMENVFQIQLRLLKATLWKLQKDSDDINEKSELATEIKNLMAKIEKCLLIGSEKEYKENKDRARQQRLKSKVELPS